MGPADTPEGVDPDADSLPCSAAVPVDPVSKLLDDDNLLIEIIVRLGFPITLVRAALVCKCWYRHASDPAFLRRFRKLHPPRLLGFYVNTGEELNPARFVPMLPRPPELDSVFRHTSFSLDAYEKGQPYVADCWKNSVLIHLVRYNGARRPVKVVHNPHFPPSPRNRLSDGNKMGVGHLLIKGGDSLSYFYVFLETTFRTESTVHVHMFQDGVWCRITSATKELTCQLQLKPLLVDNKIYIGLPLWHSCLRFENLKFLHNSAPTRGGMWPKFLHNESPGTGECGRRTTLSPADDDLGVYLIHVNELQLVIRLHEGDNWLLVDTICLREMCADLSILDCRLVKNGFVEITMVGSNAGCCVKCMRSQEMIEVCVVSILS